MAKILLIEDQEGYRATLEQALGEEHAVRAVDSGEKAVEVAAGEPVDLVVTDLKLGGMTGLEVIRRLKRADPYLEAIVMTAYGTVETAVEAINCEGLPEPLLESELFGHARGAFTDAKAARKGLIEEATEGTFFLDEIGDASLAIQSKLLKVLEDGQLRRVGENLPRSVNV